MIPKHSKYFEYLGDVVEDEYYKVYLTLEGHACQHNILYKVFGNNYDKIACNLLLGEGSSRIEVFQESGRRNGLMKPNSDAREKMRQAKLGTTHSEETKRKMSDAHIGRKKQPFSEDHKQKISDSLKGNTRRKDGKKTYKTSEETKQKLSEALKGKKKPERSEEHKRNASEAAKRAWQKRKNVV
jgi:hypothetical protein